ncbi:SpoIIE family protein phosphatase [Streptomyces sp. NEAU-Y11]|uniref:SpoIIE family protein phosphatase n=1 Tax=Streptomyces cucumeris TaxID=2962890 RepID=UPI0020C84F8C|nr:SpoIIE family protein phosphatase [Streptomyces sp. NEAU-Y11]MCP9213445.1 SpoIIE family protein phosphatase [Streptomyces sp. NEAU-Y11]
MSRAPQEGRAVLVGAEEARTRSAEDPRRLKMYEPWRMRSMMAVPVRARGQLLGLATFCRSDGRDAFDPDDLTMAEDFVSRAAVCLDNAWRYTRERGSVLALQRTMLPQKLHVPESIEVTHRYVPATAYDRAGGDWFDVLRLSGARVALMVGDVVGYGIHGVAAMGRLRTAVHSLAAMDLPPDELLAHLDDLVLRLVDEQPDTGSAATEGAHCLYTVMDLTNGRCVMARAGHVPPAMLTPDGRVTMLELPAGPPLGVGTLPFEAVEFEVPEGSTLALFTDGLLRSGGDDFEAAEKWLELALARAGLEDAADDVLTAMERGFSDDDLVLLLARPQRLGDDQVLTWDLRRDPMEVARARSLVAEALSAWGLDALVFTTELIVSERVTNAIRYGVDPCSLRLIRQSTALICEVADGTSTSPHLRHARTTDEGG